MAQDANNITTNTTLPPPPPATNQTYTVPPGCLVLVYEDFLPWDDPANVVSAYAEGLVRRLKDSVVLPLLFLIGGPSNVINMAVFYKQGLKERINVCLFALSLADFVYLLQSFLLNCENISFHKKERFGPFAAFIVNHNLTGFYGFHWVSQIISAIIASERCFCILRPLRAHSFLRTSTTAIIIVVVKVLVVGPYFLVVSRYRVLCVHEPLSQLSSMQAVPGEFYLRHQTLIDYLDAFVYGVGVPGTMMVVVTITTTLTMVKLRETAVWRAGAAAASSAGSCLSARELAVTRMLVANSLLFIACVFPNVVFRLAWLFLPDMNLGASQHNLFMVGLWLLDVVSWINSTFNVLVYLTMGSRYRHTLRQMLGLAAGKQQQQQQQQQQ